MTRSDLCNHGDAWIYVKGTVTAPNIGTATAPNNRNKKKYLNLVLHLLIA